MKNAFIRLGARLAVLPALLLPTAVYAQLAPPPPELNPTGQETSLTTIIGGVINALLGILGIIFVVLLVYAGFLYMTDQGKGDNVTKAKEIIKTSIIGIVIIVLAFAISNFVITELQSAI